MSATFGKDGIQCPPRGDRTAGATSSPGGLHNTAPRIPAYVLSTYSTAETYVRAPSTTTGVAPRSTVPIPYLYVVLYMCST